jgi:hypothetical protein
MLEHGRLDETAMIRKVTGLLVILAFPVGGAIAIAVVSAERPWPRVPVVLAAAAIGFTAWLVLSRSRLNTMQVSGKATVIGIAVVLLITAFLRNASNLEVVTGVAVIEGFVIPVLWRALMRKQGYRVDNALG